MFYRIRPIFDEKITGINGSQAETALNPVDFDDPLHIRKWNFKYIPDYVVIPIPKVKAKAKFTDLMSVSFTGSSFKLTISDKLKVIIEKYSRDKLQYLPITVQHKEKKRKGYWLTNILDFDNDKINYLKAEIVKRNYPLNNGFIIDVNNYSEYQKQKSLTEYPYSLYVRKIVLMSDLLENFIVLDNVYGGVGYYVSEKLKAEIEEAGCTGIEFEPVEQG